MRSAPPRPDEVPAQRRTARRWLPAIGVVAVIAAVTGGAQVIERAVTGATEPVTVGQTVTVLPEPGWGLVSTPDDAGNGQVLLTHGSASLFVAALPPGSGPADELARGYAGVLDDRFTQLTIGEATSDGVETVRFGYVGITADGIAVEGVVAALADRVTGAGAIFDGFAPKGSLGAAIGDVRTMVESAEVG